MAKAKQQKVRAKAAEGNVRRVTEAGRESAEDMASSGRRAAQKAADSTSHLLETSTEQLRRGSEQVASQATRNLDMAMRACPTLAAGLQSVWQEWMRYSQSAVETGMRGYSRMLQSATLPDIVAAQSELMRQEMELMLTSGRRISELSAQCINDAVQNIGRTSR